MISVIRANGSLIRGGHTAPRHLVVKVNKCNIKGGGHIVEFDTCTSHKYLASQWKHIECKEQPL